MSFFVLMSYVVTIVISIAIALWLAHLARLSAQTGSNIKEKQVKEYVDIKDNSDGLIKEEIMKEVNFVLATSQEKEDIRQKVADIITSELEKRLIQSKNDLTHKYEKIIEEEKGRGEMAWQKYNAVLTEKRSTDAVIRSISDGLVVVDGQGKVVMMNPAAEKLLGVSKKEKIGRMINENLKDEQLISLSKPGVNDKEGKEIELSSGQDETKKILRASSAVIENENGQTVGMVSVLSDITKQKELDRLKSNFVANVTHELRTPLVAIDKSVSLLLTKTAGPISDAQEQFLAIADRNLKRLSRLINDLLDLSKLEAGKMEIKPEPNSISKVIEEAALTLDSWAQTKSIKLERKIDEGIPQVNFDIDRINQVLINLIGNSLKFTPNNGSIIIEAHLRAGGSKVEVSVKDNGPGISEVDLPKLFSKFYQSSLRAPTDISGTGIGLSIAREIVQYHGGDIWVESQKGQGARFVFTLPFNKGNEAVGG